MPKQSAPKAKGKMHVEVLEEDPEFFKLPLKEQLRIMERDTIKSKGERYGIMTGLEEAAKLGKEPRIPDNVFLKNRMQTLRDALKKLRAKQVRDYKAEYALIDRMYLVEREIARAEKRPEPEPPRWDKHGSPKIPASWRHAGLDASPPKSPTKASHRSPRRSPPAADVAEPMDAGLKSALTGARDIIAKVIPNTGGLMAQLLLGVHALIKTALRKGVSPHMRRELVKYLGYTRKFLENSDDPDDKALVAQLGLVLEHLAAAGQPVRPRTKHTSAAPALSPVRKRATPTQPRPVEVEAQPRPVKRTPRPSAVGAGAQASPVRLRPARKRPVRVKQGELPASEEAAITDNDRRMVRGLQRAGATTEKGTCPLGPPPEGKACTRGFWQRRPARAGH